MIDFIFWYFFIVLIGLMAFPLAYQMLRFLPDRGWAISKPLGLLISGYSFWLLTTLQVNQNTTGGVLIGIAILAGLGIWQGFRTGWSKIFGWMKEHRVSLIVTEIVFLVAFGLWTMVRATNPEIASTEKPMEMAFINAILRSPGFPPSDPWLSGYSISYYYFGYVLVSMLIRLAGTNPSIGFNLAVALWFALAAVASYGILFNLSCRWLERNGKKVGQAVWNSLLAPFMLLIISNMEGIFEVLHARGVFWNLNADGSGTSGFWNWLGLLELNEPPTLPLGFLPERVRGIWWWRASRVVTDQNLAGAITENIDEFPFFSFYLGDLHPHVLAIPFAILAVGVILNFFFSDGTLLFPGKRLWKWLRTPDFWFGSLCIGALGFLNTWDFPMYVALAAAAYVLLRYRVEGWSFERVWDFLKGGLALGITGFVLYFPFYLGFRSQAGGILPSLSLFTRGIYFWIMFGGLLVPIGGWLIWRTVGLSSKSERRAGVKAAVWLIGGLAILSFLMGSLIIGLASNLQNGGILSNPALAGFSEKMLERAGQFFNLHGSSNFSMLILGSLMERLRHPGTWLTLFGLLFLTWALLAGGKATEKADDVESRKVPQLSPEETFNLLLVLVGIGLTLAPEFFYLLDQFGYRMNTIFKFYYQAWLLWSLAASFSVIMLWNQAGKIGKLVTRSLIVGVIAIGLIYPVAGLAERFQLPVSEWSLDGLKNMQRYNPDEYQAILWLRNAEPGIVAEAIGGQYSDYARISTHTGLPTVLGWPGHESQWGRTGEQLGSRQSDIERLYISNNWDELQSILDQYKIRYIYIGGLERSKYQIEETKFSSVLRIAFQSGQVIIFEYTPIN